MVGKGWLGTSALGWSMVCALTPLAIAQPPLESLPDHQAFQSITVDRPTPFWTLPPAATLTSPTQLIQAFYTQPLTPQALGEGDRGCFLSQTATLQRLTPQTVAVLLTQRGSCDDSWTGQQIRVDFMAEGEQWRVHWAGQRNHCRGQFWGQPGQTCP